MSMKNCFRWWQSIFDKEYTSHTSNGVSTMNVDRLDLSLFMLDYKNRLTLKDS